MYVYIESEKNLWTVGFYSPDGKWNPESDHGNRNDAIARVNFLNGGHKPDTVYAQQENNAKWRLWGGWAGNHDRRIEDATCTKCGYVHPTIRNSSISALGKYCSQCGREMIGYETY